MYEAEETTTKLLDVIWQVGRTGKITPIAVLEPVELCGAIVKRATLNNYGDILRKKIKLGSRVFIRRSNDVIPEVLGVSDGDGCDIELPTVCPSCGTELVEDGANWFCPNELDCKPQIIGKLEHLLTEIDKSKNADLAHYINALGIPGVGKKLALDLSKKYENIFALAHAHVDELIQNPDLGLITAKCIEEYFTRHIAIIENLKKKGIDPQYRATSEGGIFFGQKIVLTGTLKNYKRSEATDMIEKNGGEVQSSVTNSTTMVVVGENAGSKLDKAKKLGIKIIDENEFISLINS